MWSDLRFRLRALFQRTLSEAELADEMAFHLERQTDKHIQAGHGRAEAERLARLEFGAFERAKEACRDTRGTNFIEDAIKDLSYSFRLLRKAPAFALVAILSLALGAGVNTAMFSVIYAVLLRPLPYPNPDRIVSLSNSDGVGSLTMPEYRFLKEHSQTLTAIAGYRNAGQRQLVSAAGNRYVGSLAVTTDFLGALGIKPALGREFNDDETRAGGPQSIVISDALWKTQLNSAPDVLGRAIRLDDMDYTVVGVLPADFWFPRPLPDSLLPLRPTGSVADTGSNTQVLGRLKDGVSLRQSQAEIGALAPDFERTLQNRTANDFQGLAATLFRDSLVGNVRLNLELLFGATALLALIACSNLASLLMTRLAARRDEFAVRLAIGGSSGRLLRQLLAENLLLAAIGGAVGVGCAYGLLNGFIGLMPFSLPSAVPIAIDGTVLAFTVGLNCAAALFFTVVPFYFNQRLDCADALKTGSRAVGGLRPHARNALVVGEVALSTLLLIAAGLLINSLYQLRHEQLGFSAGHVMTVETPVAVERRANAATLAAFAEEMLDSLRGAGASDVAAVNVLPLTGQNNMPTQRFAHPENSIGGMEIRFVTPRYFELMGIPVKQGRAFTDHDGSSSTPVAIVSENVARRWWPNGGVLGDRLIVGRFADRDFKIGDSTREVVGVVGDTKAMNLKDPARPTVFIPLPQEPDAMLSGRLAWLVRTNDAGTSMKATRDAIARLIPLNQIGPFRTIDDIVDSNIGNWRFNAWLFGVFAGVAVALAAIGVFGLLSYNVAQRQQEIGMRVALGATRWDVLRLVLSQGLLLIAIGLALGLGGALFLTRFLSTLLYRIKPNDPLSYVAVTLVLIVVGALASYIPARRAARIDPMTALRSIS